MELKELFMLKKIFKTIFSANVRSYREQVKVASINQDNIQKKKPSF